MTPQNQGFSSNKTLPKMTCPKSDPVISRFQECVVVNLLLTGQSQKVDCYFLLNIYICIIMYYIHVCVIVCDFIWNKHVSLLLGVDKSTLLWSASPIPSSSMFSGACYSERALEYICAARRSVDPSLPPLTDSNLWLRTFSVAQCFKCIVQETPSLDTW